MSLLIDILLRHQTIINLLDLIIQGLTLRHHVGTSGKANSKLITASLPSINKKYVVAIHRADTLKIETEINCLLHNLRITLSTQNLNPLLESNQVSSNSEISPPNSSNTRLNPKFENINRKHQQRCSAKFHVRSWICLCKLIDRAAVEILLSNLYLKSQEEVTILLLKEVFLINLRNPAGNIGQ